MENTEKYPKFVMYQDRLIRIASPDAYPEISQVLRFEFLTDDHEVVQEFQLMKDLGLVGKVN